jgi:threonine dehydratase
VALQVFLDGVDRMVQVTDDEVEEAMRIYFADTHNVAEGAGAAGLAALMKDRAMGGGRVGTSLCGGNVDTEIFARVLAEKSGGDTD